MIIKFFILFIMLLIAGSLISGLFFLVKDPAQSRRTVKALSLRVGMSVALFVCLLIAFKLNLIHPHGL